MSYASSDDMIARFDERTLMDLCTDSGSPTPILSDSTKMSSALDSASGRVNAALLVSKLYTTTQLDSLTGVDEEYLKDIVCSLALARLVQRRPSPEVTEWAESIAKPAEEALEQLRKGQNLFNLSPQIDAGLPLVDGPTMVEYDQLNLMRDRLGGHFFPYRHLPYGRGAN